MFIFSAQPLAAGFYLPYGIPKRSCVLGVHPFVGISYVHYLFKYTVKFYPLKLQIRIIQILLFRDRYLLHQPIFAIPALQLND